MGTKFEIGRIAGIPIILDMFFVLVLILFSYPYFTRNDTQLMSAGLMIIVGLLLSILLHELGHAFAGRMFKVGVSHIELTGLGGVAHFERSLPRSVFARTVIFLAGPAANLLLWFGLSELLASGVIGRYPYVVQVVATLAYANLALLIFNLLPAFPLDGGRTLEAWLQPFLGDGWAMRIVAALGVIVALAVAYFALPSNFWLLLLAFTLFMTNIEMLQAAIGGRRR